MEKYYKILSLKEGATLEEVEQKYKQLLIEFDPEEQEDDLKEFFKSEQEKVEEAYEQISLSFANKNKQEVKSNAIDELEKDSSDDIESSYQTLKLSKDSTFAEINQQYNLLLDEFNPNHQSDNLRGFFETEQEKIKEAYNTIVKYLSEEASEAVVDVLSEDDFHDLGTYQNNDDVKYCKFCGHKQYVTNKECVNCTESFTNSFLKSSGTKNIVASGRKQEMFSAPFSFEGRIRRTEYFLSILICLFYVAIIMQPLIEQGQERLSFFLFIPCFWFFFSQGARRCHDMSESGWMQLIPIFFPFALIFTSSQIGDNEYGSNPKGLNYN